MKKLIAFLISGVIACSLAFMVSSCQSNEDKVISLSEKMIESAKKNDVKAFKEAVTEFTKVAKELKDELSKEEMEALGKKLDEKFTDADGEVIEEFMKNHATEMLDILPQLMEMDIDF